MDSDSTVQPQSSAKATLESDPKGSVVKLGGDWRLEQHVPAWKEVVKEKPKGGIRVVAADLGKWDTSLVLFLTRAQEWCESHGVKLDLKAIPAALQTMM